MKPLLAFSFLVCMFFSMSSFTVVNPPAGKVLKAVKTSKTVPSWPITVTHAGYICQIYGGGTTASYARFTSIATGVSYGPFSFTSSPGSNLFTVSIPSTSPVYTAIRAVSIGIYTNQDGYVITFYPDLS